MRSRTSAIPSLTSSRRPARSPACNRTGAPTPPMLLRLLMPTRRRFLGSLFAATATLPALKSDALARILPAARHVDGRSPEDIAQDEDFWREIQAAFDIDRGMINLNNGGVAPSP